MHNGTLPCIYLEPIVNAMNSELVTWTTGFLTLGLVASNHNPSHHIQCQAAFVGGTLVKGIVPLPREVVDVAHLVQVHLLFRYRIGNEAAFLPLHG